MLWILISSTQTFRVAGPRPARFCLEILSVVEDHGDLSSVFCRRSWSSEDHGDHLFTSKFIEKFIKKIIDKFIKKLIGKCLKKVIEEYILVYEESHVYEQFVRQKQFQYDTACRATLNQDWNITVFVLTQSVQPSNCRVANFRGLVLGCIEAGKQASTFGPFQEKEKKPKHPRATKICRENTIYYYTKNTMKH